MSGQTKTLKCTASPEDDRTDRMDEIRRRLEASRVALESSFQPTAEEQQRILLERAEELAREPKKAVDAASLIQVIEFQIAGGSFAVEPRYVRKVFPLSTLTTIPGTPGHVAGVTNLGGEVLSLINLKVLLSLSGEGLTNGTQVIVLRSEHMEFGLLADSVLGSRTILQEEIGPALPTLSGSGRLYLKGVTLDRTAILDAKLMLADESIVVNDKEWFEPGARGALKEDSCENH